MTVEFALPDVVERQTDAEVVPWQVLTPSVPFDHRIADGVDAAQFVNAVEAYLRDPDLLLLE
ncbi:2-oxo acid dehydrogenase subunit E2 [Halorarius litoreus]|uniref:2-oxo acid dehydrogenase subunit E2 n=1 Tax=Halorarius litoreus TaxID=2962676 RepID=UPI0020CF4A20|nr:2-oxo acid dehydrogenase subunit E2 [Halorarius litoreus]